MGVPRFIWRGVLTFDRIGSRIPQLTQMWLIELFFTMPVTWTPMVSADVGDNDFPAPTDAGRVLVLLTTP